VRSCVPREPFQSFTGWNRALSLLSDGVSAILRFRGSGHRSDCRHCWGPPCFVAVVVQHVRFSSEVSICQSQWPRGLRRRSAAARLLRSWVRITPGGMVVCLL
jgi:hypothetical protein